MAEPLLVVGLGKSGGASALFLKARGARVTVSDTKSPDQLRDEIPALLKDARQSMQAAIDSARDIRCNGAWSAFVLRTPVFALGAALRA